MSCQKDGVFCAKPDAEIICENELAKAFYDKFPVNEGHVLIVPKRHVSGFFEATLKKSWRSMNWLSR